ncbi:MAG: hypothetical protein C4560_08835 [Nitrospiraceae bacterium]|nr:MAG: hypothetical protein C4560_08835 [Nitrospiraceae bacterium]
MSVQNIIINEILIEKSRFSPGRFLFGLSAPGSVPEESSYRRLGTIHPIIVCRDMSGQVHLIDGAKRIYFAGLRQPGISAIVLTDATPVTDIISLIQCDKRNEIDQSVINKVMFICFALSLGAPESWVLESLCVPLGFRPYNDFLKDCGRINNLPEELRRFCHEKKFSLKQILNLTHYPEDVLSQLMSWKAMLQLTASILDEMASSLKDYLISHDKGMGDFLSEPEVHEIMGSPLGHRERTERLRSFIHKKRFPVLSETNKRIEGKVAQLYLPKNISLDWDRTLENKNLDITLHVQDIEKLKDLLDVLNSDAMKEAVKGMLDEL